MVRRHQDGQPGLIDRVRWGNIGRLAVLAAAVLVIVLGSRGGDLPPSPPRAEPFAAADEAAAPGLPAGEGRGARPDRRARAQGKAARSCERPHRGRAKRARARARRRSNEDTSTDAPDPELAPVAAPAPEPAPTPVEPAPPTEPAPDSPPSPSSASSPPRTPEFL